MPLSQAQILALHTTLKTRFNAGLGQGSEDWKKVAKRITSDGKSNTYAWLSQFPAFREWIGSRLHKVAAETAYVVANRKFENTLDIPADDIDDDNFGHYGDLAEGYGQAAKDLMNDLVFQKFMTGFNNVCYDGQYFFDTDHPVYPNEDGTGAPVNATNMIAGAGATWILLCTKRAPSAIYLQERMAPQFNALTNANSSDQVFNYDKYSFGGKWRGDAAFGFWQLAFGSKAALSAANFDIAYNGMMSQLGDGNRKLGIVADTMLVGPSRRVEAEALLLKQYLANGETNPNFQRLELVVTPWLD